MTDIPSFPVAQLPIDPFAKLFYNAALSANTLIPSSSGTYYGVDSLFTHMGVEFPDDDGSHQVIYVVANFLDRPLTLVDSYIGHGWEYLRPGIVSIPLNSPETPIPHIENFIPGQTEAMIPDSPDEWGGLYDVDTFGVGIYLTGKDGIIRGTEAAWAFKSDDPRLKDMTIGLAGCITEGGGGRYVAGTLDISSYGSIQGFHDKTVDNSKSIIADNSGDVTLRCGMGSQGQDTTKTLGSDGNANRAVYLYFIGPAPK